MGITLSDCYNTAQFRRLAKARRRRRRVALRVVRVPRGRVLGQEPGPRRPRDALRRVRLAPTPGALLALAGWAARVLGDARVLAALGRALVGAEGGDLGGKRCGPLFG